MTSNGSNHNFNNNVNYLDKNNNDAISNEESIRLSIPDDLNCIGIK